MERTFIMVKPDGVQRGYVGEVVQRFEQKGFVLAGAKLMQISEELAKEHYGEHKERLFSGELYDFITSGSFLAMIWEREAVIATSRTMIGATNPAEANPGSIRGEYAVTVGKNMILGSDSEESAAREINLFFNENELIDYTKATSNWIY